MLNNFHNYKQKALYSFFVILMLCHFYLFGNHNIRENLNKIPTSEKEDLEKLFHDLFIRGNFSYTLFAEKPMSLADYPITSFDSDGIPSNSGLRFQKRWGVWKKYAHAFPITHYLLIEEPFEMNGSKIIYFINKKYFISKVNEHLNSFQEALGKNITGALLLKKIEENHKILSFFHNHSMLLGILLGYGEHNARLFDKRNQISPFVYRKEFPKIPIKIPPPSKGFSSLQEEFNSYFSVLRHFGDCGYSPLIIHSVHFVADQMHPETIVLKQKYREERGRISAIYAKGNFLEITLSQLTSD